MQFKFLAALLLVGAYFTQVSLAHPQNSEVQRNVIDDLIDQAKKAIEELQKVLQQKIQEAWNALNQLKDQITEQAQQAIEAVKQKLNEIIAAAQKQIEEIKQKAEEVGADISECLADNEDQFKQLLEKFLQDEIQCVQNEIDQAVKIITEAIQIVTDAYKAVQDLPEKLKACGTGVNSLSCIKDVLVEVAKLEKDLPALITQKINEVTQFVSGIKVRLETCAVTQLANAGISAAQIVADVAKCAAEKVGEVSK